MIMLLSCVMGFLALQLLVVLSILGVEELKLHLFDLLIESSDHK